jgi:hypothetical protein
VRRPSATGKLILVASGTLGLTSNDQVSCDWTPRTDVQHSAHQIFRTLGGQLATIGLLVGLTGIGIDVSIKVGNVVPVIHVGAFAYAGLLIGASLLQAVGLLLVFTKAVRRGDL